MDSNTLLVGNIAVASLIIKTVMSTIKQIFPKFSENPTIIKGGTVLLGILTAFVMNLQLFQLNPEATSWFTGFMQTLLSGWFVGATAIGIHETTKDIKLPKGKKTT